MNDAIAALAYDHSEATRQIVDLLDSVVQTRYEVDNTEDISHLSASIQYDSEMITQLYEVVAKQRARLQAPSYFREALDRLLELREEFGQLLTGDGEMPCTNTIRRSLAEHARLRASVEATRVSTLEELWHRTDDPWVLLALMTLHLKDSVQIGALRRFGGQVVRWLDGEDTFHRLVSQPTVDLNELASFAAGARAQYLRAVREAEADPSCDPSLLYIGASDIRLIEALCQPHPVMEKLARALMNMVGIGLRRAHERGKSELSLIELQALAADRLREEVNPVWFEI